MIFGGINLAMPCVRREYSLGCNANNAIRILFSSTTVLLLFIRPHSMQCSTLIKNSHFSYSGKIRELRKMAPFFAGEFIYRLQHEKKDGKVAFSRQYFRQLRCPELIYCWRAPSLNSGIFSPRTVLQKPVVV